MPGINTGDIMRVMIIAESVYPYRIGGIEMHVYNLAKHLTKNGHEVEIITGEGIIKLTSRNLNLSKKSSFKRLCHLLKGRFDIIHVHGIALRRVFPCFMFETGLLLVLLKLLRKRVICTPHGGIDIILKKQELEHKMYYFVIRLILSKLIDKFIVVYPGQEDVFRKAGIDEKKVIFIPNGIPEHFFQRVDAKSFKEKYGLENQKIISFIGRLIPEKRIEDLLSIMPKVVEKKECVAVIAGPVRDSAYLTKLLDLIKKFNLQKSVLLLGEISEAEKVNLLACTDIFVSPSSYEAFGISIAEAMAYGVPVVSADNPGARYLLENGKYGYLYEVGNKEELLTKILCLIDNPKKAEEMGGRGRRRAEEFRWRKIVERVIKEAYM